MSNKLVEPQIQQSGTNKPFQIERFDPFRVQQILQNLPMVGSEG